MLFDGSALKVLTRWLFGEEQSLTDGGTRSSKAARAFGAYDDRHVPKSAGTSDAHTLSRTSCRNRPHSWTVHRPFAVNGCTALWQKPDHRFATLRS
jgi:hypothetical protein